MNVTIIHVGDFKEDYFRQAEKEYAKRLSAYCSFKTILVKEEENLKTSEFRYGKFTRVIPLEHDINPDEAKSEFKNFAKQNLQ